MARKKSTSTVAAPAATAAEPAPPPAIAEARTVPFGSLFPSPLNPRKSVGDDAALQPLCDSIVANGLLEPLLVRPLKDEHINGEAFEIIAGERRWRAIGLATRLGWLPRDVLVDVRVRQASDAELVELAATENMGRQDMHPLDEANAIAAMRRFHGDDANIARRLGIPERTLYRRVALLRLADELQADLRQGTITLQQAAAFSLGTPTAQRQQREQIQRNPTYDYYKDPAHIRRAMVEKRVPVSRAAFPLDAYTGEYLDDPETGERYFTDLAEFKELQAVAIEAKIKELKAGRWAFVKKVESWQQSGYGKAKKGDKGAGAIYWLDGDGSFHSRDNVIDPNATQKKRDAARQAAAAADEGDHDVDLADEPEAADPELEADEARAEQLATHLRANRQVALALDVMAAIGDFSWYECDGAQMAPRNRAALDLALPLLLPFLEGEPDPVADLGTIIEAIQDIDWPRHAGLYRAVSALPVEMLLQLLAALGEAWHRLENHAGLNELGMLIMQHELPLAPAGAQEAAQ